MATRKKRSPRIACRVTAVAYEGDDCWFELSGDDLPRGAPKLLAVLNPPKGLLERRGFGFLEGLRKSDQSIEVDPDFPETTVYLDTITLLVYVDGRDDAWGKIVRHNGHDCLRLLEHQR